MIVKQIVLLANSRKFYGRCLAGRELDGGRPGSWVRPVSDRPTEEVSASERQYADGSDPRVLDIVQVPLIRAVPGCHQPENWQLDANYKWNKVGTYPTDRVADLLDPPEPLWVNGTSTYNGQNDEMTHQVADTTTSSLRFIFAPDGVSLSVYVTGQDFGNPRRRVQATFEYAGSRYSLMVTDPVIEQEYRAKPDGSYQLGPAYLTVSVSEPFSSNNDNCYKLVAAIIPCG
jgi:hypothetical protein